MRCKQINITKPTISIIVPVFNVENQLDRCVESLINQTFTDIEIILVDDGSTDNSPKICDSFCKRDSRVHVIHKTNEGLGLARNSGLDIAQGRFVAFIDSDDYVKENMFEGLYNKAIETNADAVISGGFITVKADGNIIFDRDTTDEVLFDGNARQLALEMMGAMPNYHKDSVYEMSVCKGIYNNQIIEAHNIRFQSERKYISEDLIFHFDFCQHAQKVLIVPTLYYYYCENMSSLTKQYQRDRFNRNVEFYRYINTVLEKYQYGFEDRNYSQRMLISRARVVISHIVKEYPFFMRQAKTEIMDICNSPDLKEVLTSYPINSLPLMQRVFTQELKKRHWAVLYLLSFANSIRKRKVN